MKSDYNNIKQQQDHKAKQEANEEKTKKILLDEKKEKNLRHIRSYFGGTNPYD